MIRKVILKSDINKLLYYRKKGFEFSNDDYLDEVITVHISKRKRDRSYNLPIINIIAIYHFHYINPAFSYIKRRYKEMFGREIDIRTYNKYRI